MKKWADIRLELGSEMAKPDFYQSHSADIIASKTNALSESIATLEAIEEEWLTIQSQIDAAN